MRVCKAPTLVATALLLLSPLAATAVDTEDYHCPDYSEHIDALEYVEPKALSGSLSDDEIDCLEAGFDKATKQTDRSKISRVLVANAMVTDTDEWMRLVRRHLDEVEQSDPDISYLYATHLFNQDDPDYAAVIKYADLAWDRRADRWEGKTFTTRSHHLLRLKALARVKAWESAEENAVGGNDDKKALAEKRKVEAHAAAREWLDFDRASEFSWKEAAHVCVSTGSDAACGLKDGWRQR